MMKKTKEKDNQKETFPKMVEEDKEQKDGAVVNEAYVGDDEGKEEAGQRESGDVMLDLSTVDREEEVEEEDPWNAAFKTKTKYVQPWNELTTSQRVYRVAYDWICLSLFKITAVLGLLYIFVCSLQVMSAAFQLLGGKAAGKALTESEIVNNPVGGLMIGVMVTVLVQSSSTSTSIIVSMVGAGVLSVEQAIPFIMGANIGTSITNTIVATTQAKDRNEFRRAFGGATVHDMFNWLSVAILLPLEVQFSILYKMSEGFLGLFDVSPNDNVDIDFLDAITKPVTAYIVQIDKSAITDIALNQTDSSEVSLLKRCEANETGSECNHIFAYSNMSDAAIGAILLAMSLLFLCTCLILLVKVLQWILQGQKTMKLVRKALNADFPGVFSFLTGYFAIIIGACLTFLVQSSSVFTSAITPLVGMGLITIKRMYPLTLGSNIGTTGTSILAALAQPDNFLLALQISLCHLFFNILGITIWYPLPFMRNVPIKLAKNLGNDTAKYRWFAFVYLIVVFFLVPMSVFALSLAGTVVFISVAVPVGVFLAVIVFINILQAKAQCCLPKVLKDWKFLPEPLRSLRPYDAPFSKMGACCGKCYAKCRCRNDPEEQFVDEDSSDFEMSEAVSGEKMQIVESKEYKYEKKTSDKENKTDKKADDDLSTDSGVVSTNISTISGQLSTSVSNSSLKANSNSSVDEEG